MKVILGMFFLSFFLFGCDNKSEKNRKKSTIQLSCEIKKVHFIKKYDGTFVDVWYDEQYIKKNFPEEISEPILIETSKNSHAIWIDGNGTLACDHNNTGLTYLTEQDANEGFVTLFGQAFQEIDPKGQLASVFATRENQDKIGFRPHKSPENFSAHPHGILA